MNAARYRRMSTLAYEDARLELREARLAKRAGEVITFTACLARFSVIRDSAREYRDKASHWVRADDDPCRKPNCAQCAAEATYWASRSAGDMCWDSTNRGTP